MALVFEKYLFRSIDITKTRTCRTIRFARVFQFLQFFVLQRVYGIDFQMSFRRTTKIHEPFEVFLGGSCNPTTWRYEHAIPYFQSQSITFYNPQVSVWTPDLIEIEHHAKESASLLFFVIDSNTRALASIAEVCYLAACGRNLLVVMNPLPTDGSQIKFLQEKSPSNDIDNENDYDNVFQAREFLRLIIQKENLLILDNIHLALECASFLIHRKTTLLELHLKQESCLAHDSHDDGYGESIERSHSNTPSIESDHINENSLFNPEQPAIQVLSNICTYSYHFISNFFASSSSSSPVMHSCDTYIFDLYIACGHDDEQWLQTTVYPILNDLDIKYFKHENSIENDDLIDTRIFQQSKYLFYLINDNERLSTIVTELAYVIGENQHDIIVYLQTNICMNSTDILTKHERNDLERSRKYVENLATKHHVQIYRTREESWQHVLTFFL